MASRGVHRLPGSWRRAPAGHHQLGTPYQLSDLVLGLASPGSFPCPEGSPSYNLQFSKKAGDGHLVAFGTEFGQLVIVDTRVEAAVQRDHNGPVGWGQTDRARSIRSGAASTLRRLDGGGHVSLCRSWGVRQPEVVAQYRALINCIFDLEWTHGDSRMALACGDAKIRVHDVETHAEVLVLCGHGGSVKTISVNPLENSILLSGARDGSFALWDTRLQQDMPLHRMSCSTEYLALATAPANRVQTRFLSPVEQVYRANCGSFADRKRPRSFLRRDEAGSKPKPGQTIKCSDFFMGLPCHDSVTAVHWMPGGQKFLTAGQDGLVKVWDTRYALRPLQVADPAADDKSPRRSSRTSNTPSTACSSPPSSSSSAMYQNRNGNAVPRSISAGRRTGGGRKGNGGAVFGRVTGGEVVAEETSEPGGRPYGVSSVHACDDGSRIAVCTVKDHISVYSYAAGGLRPIGSFTGNKNASSYYIKAKLSPDGSLLASGATNDAVCLWQVDRPGPPIARLKGHLNEVTGVDWCRAEPLKLATCSDDETVRIWTIDPLRVAHQSAARPASSSSSSSSSSSPSPSVAPAAGSHSSTGNHDRSAIGRGEGLGPAAVRGVSGWTPLVPGLPAAGGGASSGGAGVRSPSMGKFGAGTACAGESVRWWRRGDTAEKAPVDISNSLGGNSDCAGLRRQVAGGGGGQGWRQAGGRQSQSVWDTMEVCPPQTTTTVASPQVVLSPRSRNKTAEVAARTDAVVGGSGSGGSPGSARGFQIGRNSSSSSSSGGSAAALGATQTRADENTAPGLPQRTGVAAGIPPPPEQAATETTELQNLDGSGMDVDVVPVDGSAGGSQKGSSRGLLDGLPKGWSSAARAGKGVQGAAGWQQQQQQQRQRQQEEQEGRQKQRQQQQQQQRQRQQEEQEGRQKQRQKQKQHKQKGLQTGAATSRGTSPLPPEKNHTLMAFWKRDQAGSSTDAQGKAAAQGGDD